MSFVRGFWSWKVNNQLMNDVWLILGLTLMTVPYDLGFVSINPHKGESYPHVVGSTFQVLPLTVEMRMFFRLSPTK